MSTCLVTCFDPAHRSTAATIAALKLFVSLLVVPVIISVIFIRSKADMLTSLSVLAGKPSSQVEEGQN